MSKRLLPAVSAVVLGAACLVLAGCKQDRILHDAAAFSTFQSDAAPLVGPVTGDPLQSCLRQRAYADLHNYAERPDAVQRALLDTRATPTPAPGATPAPFLAPPETIDPEALAAGCGETARGSAALRAEFDALFAYAAAIGSAGSAQNTDLKIGGLVKDLEKATILTGGPVDAAVGAVADALATFLATRQRAKAVTQLVKAADPSIQSINRAVQKSFAANSCGSLTYCFNVRQELKTADAAYETIIIESLRHANGGKPVSPGGRDLPLLSAADAAALVSLRGRWAQVHDDGRKRLADARSLAALVDQLASASHDLYNVIIAMPSADTAVFER